MRKLSSLFLLSFVLLQSCTQDELAVVPKQVSATPAGFNIESAARQISEKFVLSGAKALLLKPVDSNPNTHLTTLFYVDATSKILPVIQNIEIKQVEVTPSGIYVLTNYTEAGESFAFFVKYDNSWVQLKGLNGIDNFQFIIDNGDIVFTNDGMNQQRVFNTRTLKMGQSLENPWGHVDNIYLSGTNGQYTFYNITTGETQNTNIGFVNNFIPLHYNSMVFIETPHEPEDYSTVDHHLLNMKTGEITDVTINHENMYPLPGSAVPNTAGNGISYLSQGTLTDEYSALWGGLYYTEVVYNGTNVVEVKHEKYYGAQLTAPTPAHLLFLNARLVSGYHYKVVDNLVYYTGIAKTGKPATGVYNMATKENAVVDEKETFSSVHPFSY